MRPKTHKPLLFLTSTLMLGAAVGLSSSSNAAVQRIVIDQTATVIDPLALVASASPRSCFSEVAGGTGAGSACAQTQADPMHVVLAGEHGE